MNKPFGYKDEIPVIESVRFTSDTIVINLIDGRKLSLPINRFPDIKKLTPYQRRKHGTLAGMGLMFEDSDMVYHVTDFLGINETNGYSVERKKTNRVHSLVAEPETNYKKTRR